MNCPKCNAQNDNAAETCMVCGEPLNTETTAVEDKAATLEELHTKRIKKQKNKQRKKIVLIAAVIIAIVAATGYGIYHFVDNTDENNTIVIATKTPEIVPVPTQVVAVPTPELVPSPDASATPETTIPPEIVNAVNGAAAQTATTKPTTKPVIATTKPTTKPVVATTKPTTKPVVATTAPTTKPVVATTKPVSTAAPTVAPTIAPTTNPAEPSGIFIPRSETQAAVPSGFDIKDTLVVVESIEKPADSTRSLARFKIGNKSYYAYAEDFEYGVPAMYKIDAIPTKNLYNNNFIYSIIGIKSYAPDGYIIPHSSTHTLTSADLVLLTNTELELARNEIFARHGREFKRTEIQDYFDSRTWYNKDILYDYANDYSALTELEIANAKFILEYQNKK